MGGGERRRRRRGGEWTTEATRGRGVRVAATGAATGAATWAATVAATGVATVAATVAATAAGGTKFHGSQNADQDRFRLFQKVDAFIYLFPG